MDHLMALWHRFSCLMLLTREIWWKGENCGTERDDAAANQRTRKFHEGKLEVYRFHAELGCLRLKRVETVNRRTANRREDNLITNLLFIADNGVNQSVNRSNTAYNKYRIIFRSNARKLLVIIFCSLLWLIGYFTHNKSLKWSIRRWLLKIINFPKLVEYIHVNI